MPQLLRAQSDEATTNVLAGVHLEPFVDPLPTPQILKPHSAKSGEQSYRITLSEFRQKLHRDLPPTLVWGFEGSMPGPTILAERNCPVRVTWLNRLPRKHRLLVDHTLHGAEQDVPEVRTAIHLHGGHVSASSDGYPEDWITPGQEQRVFYPNRQTAGTLWYHDHAMGITRLNAMMGLAGVYILHDSEEDRLDLAAGRYDIPLVLQDRILDPRGQLVYPVGATADTVWVPEFLGTQIVVNGRVTPYLDVEPRPYRFRILNASNSRVFRMSLEPEQDIMQIGTEGGLLPEPVPLNELLVAPGERIDTVIDFRGREGRRLMLVNYGPAPYPAGGGLVPGPVVQFRVRWPLVQTPISAELPATLSPRASINASSAVKTRRLNLVEIMGTNGRGHRLLLNGSRFMDPITEDPKTGSTEIWEFVNLTADAHPIHLHAVHFQLLDRQAFDIRRQQRTSEVVAIGKVLAAPREEQGWKDTVVCPPGQITRILVPFTGEPGKFVWHCHMLEHEDNEMMRPYLLRS